MIRNCSETYQRGIHSSTKKSNLLKKEDIVPKISLSMEVLRNLPMMVFYLESEIDFGQLS